jgi:MFS family permease
VARSLRSVASNSTIAAFRHRDFRLLFGGILPSNVGYWMQEFAVGWLVVLVAQREGNPALAGFYLGLRGIATAVPSLVIGLVAGAYADRVDRRSMLAYSRVASAVAALALTVVVATDQVGIAILIVLAAASAAAYAFEPPTRQALLPRIVPDGDLFSAMGLMRTVLQGSQTLGPIIGGLLIVPLGIASVVFGKVGLMLLSIPFLLPMRPQPVTLEPGAPGVLGSLREGLRHMRADPLIRWCLILQLVFAVSAQAVIQLLPAVAVETLGVGAVELSWLVAAVGAGTVLGAMFLATIGRVVRRGLLLLGLMVAVGATVVGLGLQRELPGALVVAAALGILQQLFMGTHAVILQLGAPDRLRGRVMGTQAVIFQGVGPIGVLVIGSFGSLFGISTAIVGAGVVLAAVAIVAGFRVTVVRELRRTEISTAPPVEHEPGQIV